MPTANPAETPSAADATRPGDLPASRFDAYSPIVGQPPVVPVPALGAGSAFDVCHVGVVLRAVLLVQAVVALGALYSSAGQGGGLALWGEHFAPGAILSLWGVLAWLVASCALKRWLVRVRPGLQWAAALGLGALCAALAARLLGFSGLAGSVRAPAFAPPLTGAAVAAALFYWLRLRALARAPADAAARLAELQSRIRPHFLFNALNTAVALVRVDPARAETVLEDLAELFRVALSEAHEAVTLREEVDLARRYLEIEQLRFGERLKLNFDIDPQTLGVRLPPLLLQPLVENAVRHGIEPMAEGGTVRVRSRIKRAQAVIDVVNTLGAEASRPGNGIALRNVRERLRLLHDVAAQFDARRDGPVWRVRIVVPLA